MFVELDVRQDTGYTVSLEWDRDTGTTRIVIDEPDLACRLAFPVASAKSRSCIPPPLLLPPMSTTEQVAGALIAHGPSEFPEDRGPSPAAVFATTEHFNLQTARAITVSEANGRASIYLAALSSNLIALAFVGQVSRLGEAFYVFALVLLPVLAFVGIVTFLRLVQTSIEDIAYAHRIGLLRSYYVALAPELEPYLAVVRPTRPSAATGAAVRGPSVWQLTLTTAGMIAVVNSVVMAACAGLVLKVAGIDSLAGAVTAGALIGSAAFSLHERHHRCARDAFRPDGVDLSAISLQRPQQGAAS